MLNRLRRLAFPIFLLAGIGVAVRTWAELSAHGVSLSLTLACSLAAVAVGAQLGRVLSDVLDRD
ncbi:hypothetical protein LG634_37210 [Streptomyces bambusae]|uniref:hypothetical protein n=1 Tax=Streptomyces bambusae TaxID=1550616 RepID=UPI001CFFB807|nr:hypothetical protein [Streptomyces bambusae]MCB5170420.1 hypothetical protein [Streptomyces bambusae]